jgi:hypothetical protein
VRKSASVRLGLLLAVSALLLSCERERPDERRCVDGEGRFVDEGLCASGASGPTGTVGSPAGASGGWDERDGGPAPSRGGFHFIWIPYGMYGGVGSYAPGYVRGAPAGAAHGDSAPGSVSRGGFGATGAAHAAPGAVHAGAAAGSAGS